LQAKSTLSSRNTLAFLGVGGSLPTGARASASSAQIAAHRSAVHGDEVGAIRQESARFHVDLEYEHYGQPAAAYPLEHFLDPDACRVSPRPQSDPH
jgi:hypothetical protein